MAERHEGYGALLRLRDFVTYWFGQLISGVGDRLDQVAVGCLVLRSTTIEDKGSTIVLIGVMNVLPFLFITPFLGGFADRIDRRRTMIALDAFRGLIVVVAALTFTTDQPVWHYYVLVLLSGCATALYGPCKSALIPQLVPGHLLLKANTMASNSGTMGTLIGGFAGGALIIWVGGALVPPAAFAALSPQEVENYQAMATHAARSLLWVDAATFATSILTLSMLTLYPGNLPYALNDRIKKMGGYARAIADPALATEVGRVSARARNSYWEDWTASFRFVRTHTVARHLIVMTFVLWALVGFAYAGLQGIGVDFLHLGEDEQGIVLGILGLCMFLGGILVGLFDKYFKPRIVFTSALIGFAAFSFAPTIATNSFQLKIAVIPLGLMAGVILISMDTVYQKAIPNQIRGRLYALDYFVLNFALVGAQVVTVTFMSYDKTFAYTAFKAFAILAIVAAVFTWRAPSRVRTTA